MLHVVSLPHTSVSPRFNICAYTAKVYKFCRMFPEATLYANEGTSLPHVQIFSHKDKFAYFRNYDWWNIQEWYKVDYDEKLPYWKEFNRRCIARIRERIQDHDIICLIGGWSQHTIAEAFPNHIVTEFGVGYEGVFTKYRVFESYAWMHHVYGLKGQRDGGWFDAVIPNYFDREDFPESKTHDNYLLFASRPIPRKGIQIVREIGEAGHWIRTIGQEKMTGNHIEWMGYADREMRGKLMSEAKALICPTIYIEPFGGVAVEAQLCGTPVITTDWGAFPETVVQGVTGFRCRTQKEFLSAIDHVNSLDRKAIRERALTLYSMEAVKPQYQRYFNQLDTLWEKGWYTS